MYNYQYLRVSGFGVFILKIILSLSLFYRARWIKVDGIEYKKYVDVIYSMVHDLLNIGQIISIFVVNNKIPVLEVKCFSTVYIEHLRVYTLSELEFETMLITVQELVVPNPVHIRTVSALPHSKTVILPFHINV